MNEVNLNPLLRSTGIERSLNSSANQENSRVANRPAVADSVEFSHIPDLNAIDQNVEEEFAGLRANLKESVGTTLYPPLETIDKLAAMLAINLRPDRNNTR